MRSKSVEWLTNRDYMINKVEEIKQIPKHQNGIHLHLGCGCHIFEGFLNIDKYQEHAQVLNCDILKMPFTNESVDTIYSSHSLEHLPIRSANAALAYWYKLLKPDGVLYLAVPDLEEVCSILLDPNINDNLKFEWYMYVLFGWQTTIGLRTNAFDTSAPVDPGQFHCTGFTKKRLIDILTNIGFKVEKCINYDGWDTPSIWLEVKK